MQAIKLALILSAAALPLAAQAKPSARQTAGLPQFIVLPHKAATS